MPSNYDPSADSSPNNSNSSRDIFYLYVPTRKNRKTLTVVDIEDSGERPSSSVELRSSLTEYVKHCNLDLKPLSLSEQLHMIRLYYLTVPKCIYLVTVMTCLAWFVFNMVNVAKEYREHNSIVVVEFKSPDTTKPPAITFCTQCLLCQ